ncbi:MAG: RIP metalloprotease RseP [Flavobacteriaceae bacterium]|nr:RIP metalloprotease RseP [Flavobacteriaceae bacterium]
MEILIKASQFILSLSFLIVLHELGHFIPAKLFKTRVEKFYLFFDYKFSLFKKTIGGTTYGIGWIPLGGYVKISGMIDESMDLKHLDKEPEPWEFRAKPAWQRLIIMLGGVVVNFVLGFLIYVMILFVWGRDFVSVNDVHNGFEVVESFEQYGFRDGDKILTVNGETPEHVLDINKHLFLRDIKTITVLHSDNITETIELPEAIGKVMWESGDMKPFAPRGSSEIGVVAENSLAASAGVLKGDIITVANGNNVSSWNDFHQSIVGKENVSLTLLRRGELIDINITKAKDEPIGVNGDAASSITVIEKEYSIGESISGGATLAYWTLNDYISQFKYVFTKKGASSLGGFISIGNIFPATWSWEAFWNITAFLSIMLGFMNLLPIPALDGGHVIFTLYEMIVGKKPGDKFLEYAQIGGFVLLMGLLLFANGNDIVKLFS